MNMSIARYIFFLIQLIAITQKRLHSVTTTVSPPPSLEKVHYFRQYKFVDEHLVSLACKVATSFHIFTFFIRNKNFHQSLPGFLWV